MVFPIVNLYANATKSEYTLSNDVAKNQIIIKTCPSGDY